MALKDNPDVAARRGLAYYYAGETQEGIRFLEEFTATTTDHAPSWVYLGMMYEATGDTEAAKHAYVNAAKADPNDTYGLREYINGRIAQLNSDGYTSGDALELSLDDAS